MGYVVERKKQEVDDREADGTWLKVIPNPLTRGTVPSAQEGWRKEHSMEYAHFKRSTSHVLLLLFCVFAQPLASQQKAAPKTVLTSEMQAIIEQLGSQDLTTQASAIEKLKRARNKRPALPALHAFLAAHRDPVGEVNLIEVVQILIDVGDPRSLPPLQELLAREQEEFTKVFLAWGTATLGDPSGTEMVLARLKDTGAPDNLKLAEAFREPAAMACKDLINRGKLQPAVLLEVARQASKDHDSAVQKFEVNGKSLAELNKSARAGALSRSELDAVLPRLQEIHSLSEAYRNVWSRAFVILAATKKGVPVLAAALRDPDPSLVDLRATMILVLGGSKDDRAVLPLIEVLRDSQNQNLKNEARDALQNITGQKFGEDAGAWATWWEARNKK